MIAIRSVDSYRDGGTISIKCHFGFTSNDGKIDIRTHNTEICIDKRMRGKGDGSIWLGYPEKETSEKIVNEEMLEYILKCLEKYLKWQNSCIEGAITAIKNNITLEEEDL